MRRQDKDAAAYLDTMLKAREALIKAQEIHAGLPTSDNNPTPNNNQNPDLKRKVQAAAYSSVVELGKSYPSGNNMASDILLNKSVKKVPI